MYTFKDNNNNPHRRSKLDMIIYGTSLTGLFQVNQKPTIANVLSDHLLITMKL